jgi:hypothetical protein
MAACEEKAAPPAPVWPDYAVETRIIRDIDFVRNQYYYFDNALVVDITRFHPDDRNPSIPIEIWVEISPSEKLDAGFYWIPGKALVDTVGDGCALRAVADRIHRGLPLWPYRHLALDFRRLEHDIHYRYLTCFDTDAVRGIVLRQPVAEHRALAASYTTTAGDTVGGPYSMWGIPHGGGAERDTMILKMIKPKHPRPDDDFGFTWFNTLRNVYNLGLNFIEPAHTEIEIRDNTARADRTHPEGSAVPYIRIFGFDQKNRTFEPEPDGEFDLLSPYIDLEHGILTFPSLFGFAPPLDSVQRWTGGEFSFEDSLYSDRYAMSRRLYIHYLTNPFVEAYQYDIVIRVKRFH